MKVVIKNARCSFPALFTTEIYAGNDTGKYTVTFLIPKSDPQIKKIKTQMKQLAESTFGKPLPKGIDMGLIKDGDDVTYAGYADHYSIKASTNRRPVVVNTDKTPIVEADGIIYGGCYINGSVELWCQNNQYGKAIRCSLNGVQFVRDGERFGSSNDALDDFDELEAALADGDDGDVEDDFPF